jgi:hypothetical protein
MATKRTINKTTKRPNALRICGVIASIVKEFDGEKETTACIESKKYRYTFLNAQQAEKLGKQLLEMSKYLKAQK